MLKQPNSIKSNTSIELMPVLKEVVPQTIKIISDTPGHLAGVIDIQSCVRTKEGSTVLLGKLPLGTAKYAESVINNAVTQYNNGAGEWANMDPKARCEKLAQVINDVFSSQGQLAESLLMWEIGKSTTDAKVEIDRTADFALKACEAGTKLLARSEPRVCEGRMVRDILRPIGTVVCFGPSNYPINESLTTALGALVAGNSVILKLPRFGGLALTVLAEKIAEQLPHGAFQILCGEGPEVVPPVMKSPNLKGVFFIGSTKTKDRIMQHCHDRDGLVKVLGLGAKNPLYIHSSADLSDAIPKSIKAQLSFNGFRCSAGKITFIDDDIYDVAVAEFVRKISLLKKGIPSEPGVAITPVYDPSPETIAHYDELVADALKNGAKVLLEGGYDPFTGIYSPVLLGDVDSSMRIYHEEQFCPIVPFVRVREGFEEVMAYCRNSEFGQQISIFADKNKDPIAYNNMDLVSETLIGSHLAAVNFNEPPKRLDTRPFAAIKGSGFGWVDIESSVTIFTIPGYTSYSV